LHHDQVGVEERVELEDWQKRRVPWTRSLLFYTALVMVPAGVLGLLLYVARHG